MKQLKIWAGLLISGLCLWLAFKDIQFSNLVDNFGRINWWWIGVMFIPYLIAMLIKVTRWQVLLHPDKVKLPRLFSALMISYLGSTILPLRLGEVIRAYVVGRSENIGTVRVISTILLEKILDIITMFIFLVALLPFLTIKDDIRNPALVFGVLMIGAFITCMVMAAFRKQAEAFIKFFLKPLPKNIGDKLFEFASQVLDAVAVLLNWKLSLNLWIQSFLLWGATITTYQFVAFAIGLPMSFELAVLVMIVSNLGMAIPSAPGYVGVFEGVIIFLLVPTFYPESQRGLVTSYAILEHVVGFLPVVILGAYYAWREGLSFGQMTRLNGDKKPAAKPEQPAPELIEVNK